MGRGRAIRLTHDDGLRGGAQLGARAVIAVRAVRAQLHVTAVEPQLGNAAVGRGQPGDRRLRVERTMAVGVVTPHITKVARGGLQSPLDEVGAPGRVLDLEERRCGGDLRGGEGGARNHGVLNTRRERA